MQTSCCSLTACPFGAAATGPAQVLCRRQHMLIWNMPLCLAQRQKEEKNGTLCAVEGATSSPGVSTKQTWGGIASTVKSTRSPGQSGQDPCHVAPAPKTSLHWVLLRTMGLWGDTEIVRQIYFEATIPVQLARDGPPRSSWLTSVFQLDPEKDIYKSER